MVHRGQEADVPILPREGRPEAYVPQPVGKAAHDVRPAARLVEVARVLAADNTRPRAGHQLGPWTRMISTIYYVKINCAWNDAR